MSLTGSLLMSAVVAAGPLTPPPWYNFLNDYPDKAFEREWQGTTVFSVIVNTDGRPAECRVDQSAGHVELDRQACFVVMKRVRFTPAYGPAGPTYGVYRSQVIWSRPDRDFVQKDPGADLEVAVDALPAGTKTPPAVKLVYFVDARGNPSDCTPYPDNRQPQELVNAACSELFAKLPRAPLTVRGQAASAVRTAAVLFRTDR